MIRRFVPVVLLVLALLLLPALAVPAAASARSKNQEGNRLYQERKFREAQDKYSEAQLEAPEAPQLHYNLGNVLFRQGDLEKAREEYRRALAAGDVTLDPRAVYNLGNSFLAQQQFPEAISAYQRALKMNPADGDAKRNLELALLRLKQQQQQQKQPPPQSGQKQDPNQPQPSGGKQGEQPKEGPRPSGGAEEKDRPPQRPGQAPRPRDGSLTKEEAERILDALQEDEKANLKKQAEAQSGEEPDVEKDW